MEESCREKMATPAYQNKRPHPAEIPNPNASVGLLSLPPELIDCIVDYINDSTVDILNFRTDRHRHFGPHEDEPAIRNIYRLRLVCKKLCDSASRVFMPVLRIHLNEASLARAEEIVRHPQVVQGVQSIEVVLDYRPDNVANDFATFFELQVNDIYQSVRGWYYEKWEFDLDEFEN